jgi:hypothetical protein
MRLTPCSAGYQQAQWQIHDKKQRVLAASLALLITVFLALQFSYRSNKKQKTKISIDLLLY